MEKMSRERRILGGNVHLRTGKVAIWSLLGNGVVRAALAVFALGMAVAFAGCSHEPSAPAAGVDSISGERMLAAIKTLSSDEFEGRGPGSRGEQLTIDYIQKQFKDMGALPGNPDGSYLQNVPFVGITADPDMKLTFSGKGKPITAAYQKDFIAWTKRSVESVKLDGELVFVGYGVQAPEYQWNDFKNVDVKGKVLIVLVNDPPVADETMFGGKAMTYYGRWDYKYAQAVKMGAAGCFIVHETERAGYPWDAVAGSWSGTQFTLQSPDKNAGHLAVEGWITHEMAAQLFKAAGQDFAKLKAAAVSKVFQPVPLGLKAQMEIHNTLRGLDSHNVIAKRVGSDPKLKDQYVIYSAHWDHFGIGREVKGDKIYHGAKDNASGVAALLEIARAFQQLKVPPKRSVLFLAVTGEEQGLLGSQYYAEHPLYPIARTVADINMDAMNTLGVTRDIVSIGLGKSTLDEVVEAVAKEQGREVKGDPEPEKGYFYRSDHFSFAKEGVPAFDPNEGIDYVGKPEGYGMKMSDEYTQNDYHKPSDVIKPDWDLSGDVQDCKLYFLVGYRVANDGKIPEWKPNAEFKAKREESLKQSGMSQ
jgi:Zn-dependent M28 family amino/carboxypeptidase